MRDREDRRRSPVLNSFVNVVPFVPVKVIELLTVP